VWFAVPIVAMALQSPTILFLISVVPSADLSSLGSRSNRLHPPPIYSAQRAGSAGGMDPTLGWSIAQRDEGRERFMEEPAR